MSKKEKSFLAKYWWVLLLLVITPIVINYIILMPAFCPIVEDNNPWLSFFGSFVGSALMAGITLFVLEKQLKQNHAENICNAVLQVATLTNNEEKAQIDKLADALADFQSSFDFLSISQVAERMIKNQFLTSDVVLMNQLVRDIDIKGFKIDILLNPIPESPYINEYNKIFNQLYNGYGLLIADLIFFIDLMKGLPASHQEIISYIIREIENNKTVENNASPNISDIQGFTKPKSIIDIIEENKFYENIQENSPDIVRMRLLQTINKDSALKETLKSTIIKLVDYEYRCINDNFNKKIKVYAET